MCELCFRLIIANHTDTDGNFTGLDLGRPAGEHETTLVPAGVRRGQLGSVPSDATDAHKPVPDAQ